MNNAWISILVFCFIVPFAQSADVCSDYLNQQALSSKYKYYGISTFDIPARIQKVIQDAGFSGAKEVYSCSSRAGNHCIIETVGKWKLRGKWIGDFDAELKGDQAILRMEVYKRSGGDPIYGIGASSWTERYKMVLDKKKLVFQTRAKSGSRPVFEKADRESGTCTLSRNYSDGLGSILIQDTFRNLGMDSASKGIPNTSFFLDSNANLHQVVALDSQSLEVGLLDLERGVRSVVKLESLSKMRWLQYLELLKSARLGRPVTTEFLTRGSERGWKCIQASHPTVGFSDFSVGKASAGYSLIKFGRIASAPGADLDYRPLAQSTVIREGWNGDASPMLFPNGARKATLVLSNKGQSLFVYRNDQGVQFSPILGFGAPDVQKNFGIDRDVVTFGDVVCFAR